MWAVAQTVSSRATRYAYGIDMSIPRNNRDEEHRSRPAIKLTSGERIDGAWSEIVARVSFSNNEMDLGLIHTFKDTSMPCGESVELSCCREYDTSTPDLSQFSQTIYSTLLPSSTVFMFDRQSRFAIEAQRGSYSKFVGSLCPGFIAVCTVSANLQDMQGHLNKGGYRWINGNYWKLEFKVCIRFGGTEISAFIKWVHKVRPKRSFLTPDVYFFLRGKL